MKKYLLTFIITAVIFITAFAASNFFNTQRLSQIRNMEEELSIDLLSSEIQFALLEQSLCENARPGVLNEELHALSQKLSHTEQQLGAHHPEFLRAKKQYSLIQIQDWLLMQKLAERCDDHSTTAVLYFYSNDCPQCERTGYVLTLLRERYPQLRVYSFDYDLNLSAVQTLKEMYGLEDNLPAYVIDNEVYYGYKPVEAIQDITGLAPTTTPATTEATSTQEQQ